MTEVENRSEGLSTIKHKLLHDTEHVAHLCPWEEFIGLAHHNVGARRSPKLCDCLSPFTNDVARDIAEEWNSKIKIWPDTCTAHCTVHTFLRKHNEIFLLKTSTLATSTWELTFSSGCPSLPPGASLRYSRFLSRCQCSSTASPWIWILRACSTQMRINNHRFFASSRALSSDPFVS